MSDALFTAPKVTPDGVYAGARVAVRARQVGIRVHKRVRLYVSQHG